ncbi:hypothetical protein ACO0LV_12965 [Pseudactinotalea sp. Z1739]|uniref:hypothetical protein n=1 Tax=Pseudactinotalea sp. Z1739 TaxID=3413028 RepID=UPI003C7EBAAD
MSSLRTRPRRRLALALTAAAVLVLAPAALDAPAAADAAPGADGVTVVVDFTDLGGTIEVGFAPGDPANGREALEGAGFTATDSTPGMVCAIDAMPDPCPEDFDGSFWSYWTGTSGEWVAHTAGADGTDPAPGDIDGWRYHDGTAGPQITPQDALEESASGAGAPADDGADGGEDDDAAPGSDEAAADDGAADDDTTDDTTDDGTAWAGTTIWVVLALAVLVLAIVTAVWLYRRRP